jgi:hypothetical protein
MHKVLCPSPVPEERNRVHGKCNASDLAEQLSFINTSPNSSNSEIIEKIQKRRERSSSDSPRLEGSNMDPLLKKLSVQKLVLGDAEVVLEKGPDMKKKELALPLGNIAMYLLKNYVRRTQNLCCAS